ncbi:MAG: class I SAM-dependent methyltransferase [Polyangiaceae bacterium]
MTSADLPANLRVLSSLAQDTEGFDVTADRAMDALARAEDAHFWHRTRNEMVRDRLIALGFSPPARVLDLGCGGGCVAAYLDAQGYRVTGVEGHVSLATLAARRAPKASFFAHDLSLGIDALAQAVELEVDVAGLFDVIEHLDSPKIALSSALSTVRRGGVLVGTVPALMGLWSQVDVQAGHKIRYNRATLETLLASVEGAELVECGYFNRLLVPMMWAQRRVVIRDDVGSTSESNLAVPPKPINQALHALLRAEHRIEKWLDRTPISGASLWFALRRR